MAREKLEVLEERISIQPQEVGFVIGKQGKQVQGLEQLSSCRIQVNSTSNEVIITGVRACVEKARALLAYTLETFKEQVRLLAAIHAYQRKCSPRRNPLPCSSLGSPSNFERLKSVAER
jgi:hypothetical protein